ncbi:hypothetical protein HK101_006069 [Irineochytrium annulatum]|nr:hypothetical protein HK101_006069 [Irineochytrium annulatum]
MQVLSRPLKDSKVAAMNSVVDLPDTKHLVLAGLSESETNDITNWKLTRLTLHIRAVDGEVLHAIYARTQGNPLFLHMILEVAIGRIGTALEITEDGLLRRTTAYASPILDLKAAVMFMFDRLNPIFQRLLKAASILGQYFILKDVLDILSLELSEEEALEIMREEDVYSFIEYPESGSQTLNEDVVSPILITAASGNTSDVKSAGSVGMKLAFRHIGVMGAIYDLLSFEERIEMNKYIAGVLESLLTDERKDALLPSIEFHYSRTGEIEKIIQYREMIG